MTATRPSNLTSRKRTGISKGARTPGGSKHCLCFKRWSILNHGSTQLEKAEANVKIGLDKGQKYNGLQRKVEELERLHEDGKKKVCLI